MYLQQAAQRYKQYGGTASQHHSGTTPTSAVSAHVGWRQRLLLFIIYFG
jgi:hypothetical protein